jgi:Second Messenger Oligonucleotide or Dinucleotide Synthetase domain
MANVQKHFEKYHDAIRMDYDINKQLAEKRDIILAKIRKYLQDNQKPGFQAVLQGSYVMKTGVKPSGDLVYDIDVGLRFDISEGDYTAAEVRKWVYQAVKDHTNDVQPKGACIRVSYSEGYHVDLVMYAVQENWGVLSFKLAHKDRGWVDANPEALLKHVYDAMKNFEETDDAATKTNQFRRLVRYLHRWDDVAMPRESAAKPCGLAFVLLVKKYVPYKVLSGGKPDDLSALINLANAVSNSLGNISVTKPTPEYEDLFGGLTATQMVQLKTRFINLAKSLTQAKSEADEKKACQILKKEFGEDFPVPDDVRESLLAAAFTSSGPSFPNQPIIPPNKPGRFA